MITRRDVGERRGVEGGVDQSFLQEAREKNAWQNNNYLGRRTPPRFFPVGGWGWVLLGYKIANENVE